MYLLGMLSYRVFKCSKGMASHVLFTAVYIPAIEVEFCCSTPFPMKFQRFSVEWRLGDYAGHVITSIPSSSNHSLTGREVWHFVLSYWKIKFPVMPWRWTLGMRRVSQQVKVGFTIQSSLHLSQKPHTFCLDTPPHHNSTSSVLHCRLNTPLFELLILYDSESHLATLPVRSLLLVHYGWYGIHCSSKQPVHCKAYILVRSCMYLLCKCIYNIRSRTVTAGLWHSLPQVWRPTRWKHFGGSLSDTSIMSLACYKFPTK